MWHELRTACLVDTCELHAFEHAYQKVQVPYRSAAMYFMARMIYILSMYLSIYLPVFYVDIQFMARSMMPSCVVQSRTNIAVMMGQGSGGAGDVFDMRDAFLKERKKLDERRKKAEGPSPMQVCSPRTYATPATL